MRRKVPLVGSELKKKLLSGLIDDNGIRYSIREFLRKTPELNIAISNINYYLKSDEIKYAEPYRGRCIDQELLYQYYTDMGFSEISKEDFLQQNSHTKRKTCALSEEMIIIALCKEFDYPFKNTKKLFTLTNVEDTLRYIYGDDVVDTIKKDVIKMLTEKANAREQDGENISNKRNVSTKANKSVRRKQKDENGI